MQTILTFFRPMIHDAGFLESTWPHVSEEEGVRLQFQEEFDAVEYHHESIFGGNLSATLLAQRRIVTGEFHPGRRVLPHSAIEYELVYEIHTHADITEEELIQRIVRCMGAAGRGFQYQVGDKTKRKDPETKEEDAA